MEITQLKTWLSAPKKDYQLGLYLLSQIPGRTRYAERIGHRIETKDGQQDLEYELQKACDGMTATADYEAQKKQATKRTKPSAPKKTPDKPAARPVIQVKAPKGRLSREEFNEAPKEIQKVEKQWRDLYKRRGYLKAVMPHVETDEERHEHAKLVIALSKEIMQHHATIDFWREHRIVPDRKSVTRPVPTTLHEVQDELRRCRVRVSRAKKKVEKTNGKDGNEKLQEELTLKLTLEEKEQELKDVECTEAAK